MATDDGAPRTLLIDMDSVIVDLMTEWFRRYAAIYGDALTVERLLCWDTEKYVVPACGAKIYDLLDEPGLFRALPPLPGAIEALRRLSAEFEVVVVSSARTYAYTEKELWVEEHLPFIGRRNLIFTHRKDLVRGDLLFDDAPPNLRAFAATGRIAVAMDYPYNRDVAVPRVRDWPEFERFVRARVAAGKDRAAGRAAEAR